MPTEPAIPRFPTRESLNRFFRTDPRARLPIVEVAELLGVSPQALQRMLHEEGGHEGLHSLPWREAAAYLLDSWPRAAILDALDESDLGDVIPAQFRLMRVAWSLPVFVVRAMEHQAAREWQGDRRVRDRLVPSHVYAPRLDDYIADVLYAGIEPETLAAFRDDSAFLRAFYYPAGEAQEAGDDSDERVPRPMRPNGRS